MRRDIRDIILVAPTGSGKTVLSAEMLNGARQRGMGAWFTVHRQELVEQTAKTFQKFQIPFGLIAAGHEAQPDQLIQICSVQTLARRLDDMSAPKFCVWDEAHHCGAETWNRIWEKCAGGFNIGLSATPRRPDGKSLGRHFKAMVKGPTVRWLMDSRDERTGRTYLSEFKLFAPSVPDLSAVRTMAGDYNKNQIDLIMKGRAVVGDILRHWQRLAADRLTVGFAPSIAASRLYVEAFQAAGIRAAHLDGETPKDERKAVARAFARREIDVLWNVDLFGEGYDLAAHADMDVTIEAAILARPTQSVTICRQQYGRVLRPKDRPAILLDHAGNFLRHGLPDDEIEWTLEDVKRKAISGGTSVPVRQCPTCYFAHRPAAACPECGYIYPEKPREVIEMGGDLEEVKKGAKKSDDEKAALAQEVADARSYADLRRIEEARGYKKGWAYMKAKARGYFKKGKGGGGVNINI